jgi:hypothetical protein
MILNDQTIGDDSERERGIKTGVNINEKVRSMVGSMRDDEIS